VASNSSAAPSEKSLHGLDNADVGAYCRIQLSFSRKVFVFEKFSFSQRVTHFVIFAKSASKLKFVAKFYSKTHSNCHIIAKIVVNFREFFFSIGEKSFVRNFR
jgi:hypothetical protein